MTSSACQLVTRGRNQGLLDGERVVCATCSSHTLYPTIRTGTLDTRTSGRKGGGGGSPAPRFHLGAGTSVQPRVGPDGESKPQVPRYTAHYPPCEAEHARRRRRGC